MLRVGFYDPKKDRMMHVEPWRNALEEAKFAGVQMAGIYQTGNHSMPSPIWCIWDDRDDDICSIFYLGDPDDPECTQQDLDHVMTVISKWSKSRH